MPDVVMNQPLSCEPLMHLERLGQQRRIKVSKGMAPGEFDPVRRRVVDGVFMEAQRPALRCASDALDASRQRERC